MGTDFHFNPPPNPKPKKIPGIVITESCEVELVVWYTPEHMEIYREGLTQGSGWYAGECTVYTRSDLAELDMGSDLYEMVKSNLDDAELAGDC